MDLRTVLVPEPVRVLPKDTVGESELRGLSSERRLLERVQAGSRSAVDALFERYGSWLRRWARGRLPVWVRGAIDTSDVVQDTLQHTFAQLGGIKPKQASVLRAYLRRAVENRIRDELRRAARRRDSIAPDEAVRFSDAAAPQHRQLVDEETWRRYLSCLGQLTPPERRLIVGRAELGYNYQQLALIERLPSPDAARMALRRAVIRLSSAIQDP